VLKEAVDSKSNYETEYHVRRHDGVYRHFIALGIPVFNNEGLIQQWVGTCIDITERKKIEEALEEERRRLQQALDEVKTLRGIVPICANCKKIRDDKRCWNQV